MRDAGKARDRTPEFPAQLAAVVRDIGRLGGTTVPAPVPGGQHRVRIDPTDDPDEEVREPARARSVWRAGRRPTPARPPAWRGSTRPHQALGERTQGLWESAAWRDDGAPADAALRPPP